LLFELFVYAGSNFVNDGLDDAAPDDEVDSV
jgi:hypothetical protein